MQMQPAGRKPVSGDGITLKVLNNAPGSRPGSWLTRRACPPLLLLPSCLLQSLSPFHSVVLPLLLLGRMLSLPLDPPLLCSLPPAIARTGQLADCHRGKYQDCSCGSEVQHCLVPANRLALHCKAAAAGAAFSCAAAVPLNQAPDVGQAVGAAARPNQLAARLLGQGRSEANAADGRRPCKEGRGKGPQGGVQ